MALHKEFKDYTKEEVNEIKSRVCIAHKCPYLHSVSETSGTPKRGKSKTANKVCCCYILHTGHIRKEMPDDCKHYKDKGVKRLKSAMSITTQF